ncbi:MAG TPA: glycosyl transferase family 2 [Cyanobacteria bacterium UBA11149]|nr:glycosyl transferase family 2 [Cyanobacteria bacterium UBA11367]HBE57947.1 glycosyl transferase family 2 [Cyanobacteria bacterium UBA11366]HBK62864.1 glycosyl transferase family 2 [Cyanobacteria bacterium UBA11166]HBR76020.1 glycosyl transferase family 2 [Cyanobacteria bacterium UBA11159]HBS71032.1 glycosyl transferase family 2 [Cyanobacteria bacterium UBA11153]HBW90876.1 glycosyl transferase family 2 [Cyanobacteria bacterium UBA11149]HCA96209.1 glycosyl transferase family 2 [Cyanobacteria
MDTNINQPWVTWLMPVKNGMPYLPETLASIEAQTYKNWQILVWDNGSNDGTLAELHKWIPSRLPGKIIEGKPLSVGGACAELVKQCETDLAARIDADDVNLPERLEKQVAFLQAHPDIAVVGSGVFTIDEEGNTLEKPNKFPLHHKDIVYHLLVDNAINHPTVVFRCSVILEVGNYRDILYMEDLDLWLRVAQSYKLANIPELLVKYRIHSRSSTQMAIAQNKLFDQTNNCWAEYAQSLYGLSRRDAEQLRSKKHPLALIALFKIANYLGHSHGDNWWGIWQEKHFIISGRAVIANKDIISRILWAILWYWSQKQNPLMYGQNRDKI